MWVIDNDILVYSFLLYLKIVFAKLDAWDGKRTVQMAPNSNDLISYLKVGVCMTHTYLLRGYWLLLPHKDRTNPRKQHPGPRRRSIQASIFPPFACNFSTPFPKYLNPVPPQTIPTPLPKSNRNVFFNPHISLFPISFIFLFPVAIPGINWSNPYLLPTDFRYRSSVSFSFFLNTCCNLFNHWMIENWSNPFSRSMPVCLCLFDDVFV